jgi:hypothetical protein
MKGFHEESLQARFDLRGGAHQHSFEKSNCRLPDHQGSRQDINERPGAGVLHQCGERCRGCKSHVAKEVDEGGFLDVVRGGRDKGEYGGYERYNFVVK